LQAGRALGKPRARSKRVVFVSQVPNLAPSQMIKKVCCKIEEDALQEQKKKNEKRTEVFRSIQWGPKGTERLAFQKKGYF